MADDNLLMEEAKNGNKEAFEKLINIHKIPAEYFALRYVHDQFLAEEIVEDCFVKLYINMDKYQKCFTFKTYFYTLIKHKAIDELRKRNKQVEMPLDDMYSITTPESEYLEKEVFNSLNEKINALRLSDGDSFYLFAVVGLPIKTISKQLGLSPTNVKVKIYRERKKLRKLLEQEGLL